MKDSSGNNITPGAGQWSLAGLGGVSWAEDDLHARAAPRRGVDSLALVHLLVRERWGIENHDFLVRDVTFGEDRCRVRGLAAMGLAHLRGFAINCLRVWGLSNLTVALERFAARPFELLARLGVA